VTEPLSIKSLKALRAAEEGCRRCPLHKYASQVVPGEGPTRARLMMVGSKPGGQEDKQGRPFVGPAAVFWLRRLLTLALNAKRFSSPTQ
jgi:uracil-DNA glycosylase